MPSPTLSPAIDAASFQAALSVRSEMALWAEPVIADRIADIYRERAPTASLSSLLATQHRRLWRALLLDRRDLAERIWIDLARDLARAGLDREVTDEVDAVILDELMDIVFARYRSSRDKARSCSRVLLAAAAQTGAVKPFQAHHAAV